MSEFRQKVSCFFFQFAYAFAVLGVVFIPFAFHLLPFLNDVTDAVFGGVIDKIHALLTSIPEHLSISSDSLGMYYLLVLLLGLALIWALLFGEIKIDSEKQNQLNSLINSLIVYYLATILLKYGFDKITKSQFHLPEPNTLYSQFGQLPKDFLYWSVMGLSYPYNLATGLAEVAAGLFLLFQRTRIFGLIFSMLLLAHIVLLNIGFDISVKLFSSFLLFLNLLLLWPWLATLYGFFFQQKSARLAPVSPIMLLPDWVKNGLKTFIIGCMFIEAWYPQLLGASFNRDLEQRPALHGAYAVLDATNWVKRVFIHREGYLIFQQNDNSFRDYKMSIDTMLHQFRLLDYDQNTYTLRYQVAGDTLQIDGKLGRVGEVHCQATALDWRKLPALEGGYWE